MLLIIDNYDSFTWNIYQYFSQLGMKVEVYRNDKISISEINILKPSHLVISPGPYSPSKAGISLNAIQYFAGKIPILGICLGHQALAQAFGGHIVSTKHIMHGRVSKIIHKQKGIFVGLRNPLNVVCYNSLTVESKTLPRCFEVTSWSVNNNQSREIMGLRHKYLSLEGVQFHPESILSEQGYELLGNFIKY